MTRSLAQRPLAGCLRGLLVVLLLFMLAPAPVPSVSASPQELARRGITRPVTAARPSAVTGGAEQPRLHTHVAAAAPAVVSIAATKTDLLQNDADGSGGPTPGDTIRYTVVITNSGDTDAAGVIFSDTPDPNTTLSGTLHTAPVAFNDAYTSLGNVGISVPTGSGVLANDIDPDNVVSLAVASFSPTSANGGAVSVTANGSFTYTPAPGFRGTDSFSYSLTDNDPLTPNSTGQVTIQVGPVIWFVNNTAAGPGSGTLAAPFNSIANFMTLAADQTGDVIFIYRGDGSSTNYDTGITLLASQQLIGQGVDLVTAAGLTVPPFSPSLPTATSNPLLVNSAGDSVTLGTGNTVKGLTIGNTAGAGLKGSSFGTLTVATVTINGSGQIVDLNTGTLAVTFDSLASSSTSGGLRAIDVQNVTGSFTTGATTISAPANDAVRLLNSSGTTFTFNGLTLSTTGQRGLLASSAGTLNITGAANTASTTNSVAIEISNTTIGASGVTWQSVSANGGDKGIVLNNTGSGAFTVSGTGTTAGSGGTLQNINKRGVEVTTAQNVTLKNMNLTNATLVQDVAPNTPTCTDEPNGNNLGCNAPVYLVDASNVVLNNVAINGSVQQGINGNNVNGLSLTTVTVSNIGNENKENGLHVINLLGTNTWSTVNISGSRTRNVLIENNRGGSTITVSGSTFNNAVLEDGFHVIGGSAGGQNATIDLTVQNSTFSQNHSVQLKAHAEDNSTVTANLTGNTITGIAAQVGNFGVDLAARDTADLNLTVSNSTFNSVRSHDINLFVSGGGGAVGTISGNTLNGSTVGAGIRVIGEVTTNANPTITINIANNDINAIAGTGLAGIDVRARRGVISATGLANIQATVSNNQVDVTNTADANIQFYINYGNTLCGNVINNAATGTPFYGDAFYVGNPVAGSGDPAGITQLQGWTGNIDTTWNNNGNTPVNSAFLDGTATSGTCATVLRPPAPGAAAQASVPAQGQPQTVIRPDDQGVSRATPSLVAPAAGRIDPAAIAAGLTAAPAAGSPHAQVGPFTLPAGQHITIVFDVVVNAPPPIVSQVCNQGSVAGNNFTTVLTDDPATGAPADPTCTPLQTGTIRIHKVTLPAGGTGFGFTSAIPGHLTFTLNDGQTEEMLAVVPGIYTVSENDPAPGAILIGLVCNDGSSAVPSTYDVGTRTATIRLEPHETVECTFTNHLLPLAMLLSKSVNGPTSVTLPGGAGQIGYTVGYTNTNAISAIVTFVDSPSINAGSVACSTPGQVTLGAGLSGAQPVACDVSIVPDRCAPITATLQNTVTASIVPADMAPLDQSANAPPVTITVPPSDPTNPLCNPQFSVALTKTVGLSPSTCAATNNITVPPGGVDVTYCFTVENTGNITLSTHSLVDNQLGVILNNFPYSLLPGATAYVTATANITETTVNTATWTATHADPPGQASAMASATVVVEPPTAVGLTGVGIATSRTVLPWAAPLAVALLAAGLSLGLRWWHKRRAWR